MARPKYKLELNVNELLNIPQVSGECYLDLQIRDSKRLKSTAFRGLSMKGSSTSILGLDSEKSSTTSLLNDNNISTSGNVSLTTSHKKIHNFKCSFNYKVSCNLKFGIKRRENLIADKYLLMKIYYVGDRSKDGHHHNNKLELGKLEINLAEYLNFNEPVTSKYLLKDSKVNSILNLTIHLTELPAKFDFHTQLQVTDATGTIPHADTKIDKLKSSTHTQYNVPQFERKNIFGGFSDVIGAENRSKTTEFKKEHSPNSIDTRSKSIKRSASKSHASNSTSNEQPSVGKPFDEPVIIDPIINELYKRILESTWDPKLHTLMEFSPQVCVDSLFDGSISQLKQKLKDELTDVNDEDDDVRCIHGLVNETNYREDLKSWVVKDVH